MLTLFDRPTWLLAGIAAVAVAAPACSGGDSAADDDGMTPDGASGSPDGSSPDGSSPDAQLVDGTAGDPDAVIPDAPPPDAALPPFELGPYAVLSESGLYSNIETHTIAPGIQEFEPEFKLWSDGAEKLRWIRLPPGTQIDTSAMDEWLFPIGTTAWKEFRDPVTDKRLETRIIQRVENDDQGRPVFYFASFIWNEDDTEAVFDETQFNPPRDIPAGCSACPSPPCEQYPTSCHIVPPWGTCNECHGGQSHKLLGFSAVQLSHDGPGLTLSGLADAGLLTAPPSDGATFPVPGTPVERAALGYLHANCGHCHTADFNLPCYSLTDVDGPGMVARILSTDRTVEDTQVYRDAVGQPLRYWLGPAQGNHTLEDLGELMTTRIVPGDPSRSAVWYRMSVRNWGALPPNDEHQQMPYFATNEVDEDGLSAVELWINSIGVAP